ncbi:MAG TPA: lysine 2,3-aminomutase [Cytophagales bacterium]|nr:lysine 2,3-aminomutase [Cytophagales bacterium]
MQEVFEILSYVFHFKINNYVLEHLLDWDHTHTDPIFRLLFPNQEMLPAENYDLLRTYQVASMPPALIRQMALEMAEKIAPPSLTFDRCIPRAQDGTPLPGMYHNYRGQLNLFASPALRTCHAYCAYCFRWAMFNDTPSQNLGSYDDPMLPVDYLNRHPEITDVVFTGADPLVMKAEVLHQYLQPLLDVPSLQVIRIHTKSLAYWPFRFTTDPDADDLLRVFESVRARGKYLSLSAHCSHPRELTTPPVQEAVRRVRGAGVGIRCQGPLIKGVNDSSSDWANIWHQAIALDIQPHAMFMECGQNPGHCFQVPMAQALTIFEEAQQSTSGLARSVLGPLFIDQPIRALLAGKTTLMGETYFVLKPQQAPPFMQANAHLQLIPYDTTRAHPGNLMDLFQVAETDEVTNPTSPYYAAPS